MAPYRPTGPLRQAPREPRDTEAGFTLLEILIAFAIAALALGALLRGTAAGLASTDAAGRYEEALERARSHLARLASRETFSPMDDRGDDGDGYRWEHHVAAVATDAARNDLRRARDAGPPVTLYAVSVAITWTAGRAERSVRLDTRRIGLGAVPGQ